ncbi:hypothetical protein [Bartonella birtlesii]|uniref:Uncharacterized protein n=1 Tax=Bartonella birtlesii LL-WM9 TaxID=1094552 RepID=J1ITD9_9HYPH|nr:hypothetical protein [Bartonella birtlesii]EJF74842.1 hypothetical protein ME7_01213 [Bartonella birtlesii LL-WM9]
MLKMKHEWFEYITLLWHGLLLELLIFCAGKENFGKMTDDYGGKFSLGFCGERVFDYERNVWVRKHIL